MTNNTLSGKLKPLIQKILSSSSKMAGATLISRILGLIREQVMAALFGASAATDAFNVAYRIPNMLRDLFAENAFASAFIPVMTGLHKKNPEQAKQLFRSLFLLLGIITTIISLAIIVWAPQLTLLMTDQSFSGEPYRFELTVLLTRIMAPFLVLVSLAALFMGTLNMLKFFFLPSLAPACFNGIMIASMLLIPEKMEQMGLHPALSMALGVIMGGFGQMLIQIPLLFKNNFSPIGPVRLASTPIQKIVKHLGFATIGIGANQINILVTTILATGTLTGAVSWLNYAFRLFQFPLGVLGVSVANSNLVHFSEYYKQGNVKQAAKTLQSSYLLSLTFMIPATILLFFTAKECVHLIFERNAFKPEDTDMTFQALQMYALGLIFYGLYKVFSPTFFAIERPRLPVVISTISIAFNILFCTVLTPHYGFLTLAAGTGLSMLLNSLLQAFFLKKILNLPLSFFINIKIFKLIFAGIICGIVLKATQEHLFPWEKGTMLKMGGLGGVFFLSLLAYIAPLVAMGEIALPKKTNHSSS